MSIRPQTQLIGYCDLQTKTGGFAMNRWKQSLSDFIAIADWGNAFRTEAIRNIRSVPVVLSGRFIGSSSRINKLSKSHWLSRLITPPVTSIGMGALDDSTRR